CMYPSELAPLVPSLQCHWLYIHVITVSLEQGILAFSFVTGLIYLVRQVDHSVSSTRTTWLVHIILLVLVFLGFIILTVYFKNYEAEFEYPNIKGETVTTEYHLPAIAGPKDGTLLTKDRMEPLFETPGWMKGEDAGKKFNTLIWSFLTGTLLYILLRDRKST